MLIWFRNDLRTHDNPALHYLLNKRSVLNNNGEQATIRALFFISEPQWQQHDWSAIKIDLIKRHAYTLKQSLNALNITLDIVSVNTFADQITYLTSYCAKHGISNIAVNSEVEVNEQQRDNTCIEQGLPLTVFEADVIVPKGKIRNLSGEMYKVFTPFKKTWLAYVRACGVEYLGKVSDHHQVEPLPQHSQATTENNDNLPEGNTSNLSAHWPLASVVEQSVIPEFLQNKLLQYAEHRDIPSIKGTSGLSPYLAAGLISPRYLLTLLLNKFPDLLTASDSEAFTWLNELIWRDFYRHLLFHQPRLCKHQCFNLKYQATVWPNNPSYFIAWQQGKTGYPLVDAAMRQLNQTGWMHNRLRMVVASFLTKHLLIDWRWGEKYFMQQLIDGDLAANNGGWQWAASTGCDAQPYFRIFNPIRQSERFDPNGDFIRKYLPELKEIPNKDIHFPHKYISKHGIKQYWPAIVDHKDARAMALTFYK